MNVNAKYSKASKGTVKVKNSNDRLQLVFSYGGKRHYLSTGFTDTDSHRKLAEMKARQIELDILSGNFDPTLEKYGPPKVELVTPIFPQFLNQKPNRKRSAHCWETCGNGTQSSSALAYPLAP